MRMYAYLYLKFVNKKVSGMNEYMYVCIGVYACTAKQKNRSFHHDAA